MAIYVDLERKLYNPNIHKIFSDVSGSRGNVIDRFGMLPTFEDCVVDRKPQTNVSSFVDLCVSRALEIIKTNRKIYILSSDGVDSCTIVAAFLLAGAHDFTVVNFHTNESNSYIMLKLKGKGVHYSNWDTPKFESNSLIVDGSCGDEISGYGSRLRRVGDIESTDAFNKEIYTRIVNNEILNNWLKKAYLPINNINEVIWYISYALKWRECCGTHSMCFLKYTFGYDINLNNLVPFFSSSEFSDWAYTNYDRILGETYYKPEFKSLIAEVIGDSKELRCYPKIHSVPLITQQNYNFSKQPKHIELSNSKLSLIL